MSTPKQVLANRRNAQKSTGPHSIEGKAITSQNAIKHGFSASQAVITDEDPRDYCLHRDQLLAELAPSTPLESMLAERLITLSWRLKRASRLQTQTINALHSKNTNKPFSNLIQTMLSRQALPVASKHCEDGNDDASPQLTTHDPQAANNPLGRTIIRDFSNARVLDRLLMYERRIEHSLFKTILEIQRLNLIRQMTPPADPND